MAGRKKKLVLFYYVLGECRMLYVEVVEVVEEERQKERERGGERERLKRQGVLLLSAQ